MILEIGFGIVFFAFIIILIKSKNIGKDSD
jgi:hypothetical protein